MKASLKNAINDRLREIERLTEEVTGLLIPHYESLYPDKDSRVVAEYARSDFERSSLANVARLRKYHDLPIGHCPVYQIRISDVGTGYRAILERDGNEWQSRDIKAKNIGDACFKAYAVFDAYVIDSVYFYTDEKGETS